jgi:hypothetical protein
MTKYIVEKLEHGAKAVNVQFTDDNLIVDLADGRTISVPLMLYPRLYHGSITERENWVIEGEGIHWPALDEDIRTADLLSDYLRQRARNRSNGGSKGEK